METQRNLLTISLVAICAILYFKWIDFSNLQNTPTEQQVEQNNSVPDIEVSTSDSGVPTTPTATNSSNVDDIPGVVEVVDTSKLITVETDLIRATINTKGGVIERLELKDEPVALDKPDQGFLLLQNEGGNVFVAQDGVLSQQGSLTHDQQYNSTQREYTLGDTQDIVVPLTWRSESGVEFVKTLTFKRDSYVVDINYQVNNTSSEPWTGFIYGQFNSSLPESTGGGFGRLPSYTGAAYFIDKYEKVDFDDMEEANLDLEAGAGWVAMLQHYFVGAWLPKEGNYKFYTTVKKSGDKRYRVGFKSTEGVTVEAGASGNLSTRVYLGSKQQSRLKRHQKDGVEGLALTVDYGMLTFIADPLFTVLSWIHNIVGNWGWAIILLTILIKIIFYPLSAASYRSMGKMKKLQPRMQTLKERYKDDRQKFQMEMMAMYKKEKVNPAGGCLPILIQIPVFIALYWVLLESVEMRQAPFALWWQDLSAKDPYYVLPILMGLSMFLMQKLNPAPMDEIQKKVMAIMPFALTFLFMTFPQGLVLYWVVNNVLTMAQQWFNYRQQDK